MAHPKVCAALRQTRESLEPKITQDMLAERTGFRQTQISRWERTNEPSLDELAALEKAMGVAPGTVLRAAGYVKDAKTVDEVVHTDPNLAPELVGVVLQAYRAAVTASASIRGHGDRPKKPPDPPRTRALTDGPPGRGRRTGQISGSG